jgi:hypothetical protein
LLAVKFYKNSGAVALGMQNFGAVCWKGEALIAIVLRDHAKNVHQLSSASARSHRSIAWAKVRDLIAGLELVVPSSYGLAFAHRF